MLETLPPAEPDRILGLMAAFREDPRPEKIDLGVGVYRDESGGTPILRAVHEAERRLWAAERTKAYTGLLGDAAFVERLGTEALGDGLMAQAAGCQSTGGSGALFTLARLIREADPKATVHVPRPTWPNHAPLLRAAGLPIAEYPWLDADGRALDFAALTEALDRLGPGDAVILHACCHNPSGEDPGPAQWDEIAALAARRGWLPVFDAAYLGFADGWEADCAGLRAVASAVPETLAALSCSKNFGLYRDRAGAAYAVTADPERRARAREALAAINRSVQSMPPDHGGAIVRVILEDASLRADWRAELDAMRDRLADNRRLLAAALSARPGGERLSFVGDQRGMFSLLGLDEAQVNELRTSHAIYVVPGGRINVAGLPRRHVDRVAEALLSVL
jgi:aspartate/tyrosine/aromatic aminotransferase